MERAREGGRRGKPEGGGDDRRRDQASPAEAHDERPEILCGVHPVVEALNRNRPFERIVLIRREEATGGRIGQVHRMARERGIPVQFVPGQALERLAEGARHQGVVAVLAAHAAVPLEELLAGLHPPELLVLADGVQDPRNLGAIIRTAAAAGAGGVVIPAHGAAGLTPGAAKAASGALDLLPVAREGNLAEVIPRLKERGFWVVGLDARGEDDWTDPDFTLPTALVVGGEEGLRDLVRRRCDRVVRLPLAPGVESLNVSVAAGIVLYEVLRQRTQRKPAPGPRARRAPSDPSDPAEE